MSIPGSGSPLLLATTAAAAAADTAYVIPKSLRFNSADSAYLTRTPSSAGNRRTFTFSTWLKRSETGQDHRLFESSESTADQTTIKFIGAKLQIFDRQSNNVKMNLQTDRLFRDLSAWYHIVVAIDSTESTEANRVKVYVNGVQETSFSTSTYPSQNQEFYLNQANKPYDIGRFRGGSGQALNGYLADIQFVDGQQLAPTDFGETRSSDGVWVPKEFTRTSPNNGTTWSSLVSNAASSYPATNLFDGDLTTYAEGTNGGGDVTFSGGTITGTTIEFYGGKAGSSTFSVNGVDKTSLVPSSSGWFTITGVTSITAFAFNRGGPGNYVDLFAIRVDGEILLDGFNNSSGYGRNGFHLNFSDSSTNEALGFDSAPTIPALDPKKGMDVITYSGSSSPQNIGGLNFEPGLVWIKRRTGSAKDHCLVDVVRGPRNRLRSESTAQETTEEVVTAFNPGGFTIGTDAGVNQQNYAFVAWCWAAGGVAVSNTSGSINAEVSANTDYGFSVVKWTANNNYATIGHGLTNQTPKFILVKSTASGTNWVVYHHSLGNTKGLNLNLDGTGSTYQDFWNNTSPTTSVFSVGNFANYQTAAHVAYVWSEVSGYSKFSSYTGNGSSTGPVITTGFKPRFLIIKKTSGTGPWYIYDSERDNSGNIDQLLQADSNAAEFTTGANYVDFQDNGFQLKGTGGDSNASGATYIYMAWADRPGNNFDVNNIVTNEGLTTSKTQFDVVTYTGNGGTNIIGGEVYSSTSSIAVNNSNSSQSGSLAAVFNGTQVANASNAYGFLSGAMDFTWTPSTAISYSSKVRVWTGFANGSVYLNGGSAVSTNNNNWTTLVSGSSGTITSIRFTVGSSGGWWAGIEVDDVVLTDGSQPGLKFQPDLVWVKKRNGATYHALVDSVRGVNKELASNATDAEATPVTSGLTAFNSDGFTLGANSGWNANNDTFVAWCWKGGGTAVSNTDGSITSSVSANAQYGFSIVSWDYDGTTGQYTVGHGLNTAPSMIIVRPREITSNWGVYHSALGNTAGINLNQNNSSSTSTGWWNNTSPTNSVFTLSTFFDDNSEYIAYCFADVPGYQRVGQYTGNGSTSGNTIVTGFKARFVLIKCFNDDSMSDTDNSHTAWAMFDTERNETTKHLFANLNGAEGVRGNNSGTSGSADMTVEATNDGFIVKGPGSEVNANNGKYIYLAIGDDEIGSDEDCLVDVPNAVTADADATDTTGGYQRGNYMTINPLSIPSQSVTLSNGNLDMSGGGTNVARVGTIAIPSSGKWYWEITCNSGGSGLWLLGINGDTNSQAKRLLYVSDARKYTDTGGGFSSYGSSFTTGDVIGVAVDMDADTLEFYKNGVNQGTAFTSISSGYTDGIFPYFQVEASSRSLSLNAGQMRFKYPMPSGFSALNTTALPAPTIADGSAYFDTKLYTGNGSTQTISGYEFSPDFVWLKLRSGSSTVWHVLADTIRGNKALFSNATNAEISGYVNGFTSDGFGVQVSPNDTANSNNNPYVAWAWDAGSSTVSNTDGSVTSSVRANASAGFSIVKYSLTGQNAQTIGHGLNSSLGLLITKATGTTNGWAIWHSAFSNTQGIAFTTGAVGTQTWWDQSNMTNSVFAHKAGTTSSQGGEIIAYCFAPVAGYSAFGSYDGNGSSDGPFLHTGHRPAWIMVKCYDTSTSSTNWIIWDTARDPSNMAEIPLRADLANAEIAASDNYDIDILSNGFKIRTSNGGINHASRSYIFVSFAENPFQANGGLAR